MTLSLVLCGAIMTSNPAGQASPCPDLPKEVRKSVDEALSIAQRRYDAEYYKREYATSKKQNGVHAHFLTVLLKVSRQVDKSLVEKVKNTTGPCIEKSVILMARDYAEHPEHYKEIVNVYSRPANPMRRVLRPPAVKKKHVTEPFRPAWELLLLAPMNRATAFMEINGANRILEALATIQKNESIPVLVEAYKATVQKGVGKTDRQRAILFSLNLFHNKPALAAMLNCLSLSEKAAKNGKLQKTAGFTVRGWVFRLLTDQEHFGNAAEWEAVLKDYPTKDLSEKDRKMLQEALRTLQAGKQKKKPKP